MENLEWIELIFLPPNTTFPTQTMNQGIIRALKAKYCSLAVCKLISAFEKNQRIPIISILSAMIVLGKAWNAVSNKAFTNCFKKSA